ncbi:MAG: hypothetical protein R2851_20420 [Caldilineaceae bacterium]
MPIVRLPQPAQLGRTGRRRPELLAAERRLLQPLVDAIAAHDEERSPGPR